MALKIAFYRLFLPLFGMDSRFRGNDTHRESIKKNRFSMLGSYVFGVELRLIIISGLPGSGKSTLAEAIAKKLKLPIFSVDPIESSIIKSGIPRSFETGLAAYLIAEALAEEQLKINFSVIIDAVSAAEEAREMWRTLAKKFNAKLVIIECVLSHELHKSRIKSRVRNMHGIPEVTWDDVESCRRTYLPWDEERLVIDSANKLNKNLDMALEYIGEHLEWQLTDKIRL